MTLTVAANMTGSRLPRPQVPIDALVQAGYAVFPLAGKRPAIDSWTPYKTRRPTSDELAAWRKHWPATNWAIVLGRVSGVFAIDIDDPAACPDLVERLKAESTLAVRTARGFHFYFRYPTDRAVPSLTLGVLADGAECRSDDHYCVAPGSVHPGDASKDLPPGAMYQSNGKQPINAPAWLLSMADAATKPKQASKPAPTLPYKSVYAPDDDISADKVAYALAAIPQSAYASYEGWIKLGKALYNLGGEGLRLWNTITTPGKYTCEAKWATFETDSKPIAIQYVFKLAYDADPTWQKRYCAEHRSLRRALQPANACAVGSALHAGQPLTDKAISALLNIAPEFAPLACVMAATGVGVNAPASVADLMSAGLSIGVTISKPTMYRALAWAVGKGIFSKVLPAGDLFIEREAAHTGNTFENGFQLADPDALIEALKPLANAAALGWYFRKDEQPVPMPSPLILDPEDADVMRGHFGEQIERQPEYGEQRKKAANAVTGWLSALTSDQPGALFTTPIRNVSDLRVVLYRRYIGRYNGKPVGNALIARYLGVSINYVASIEKLAGVESEDNVFELPISRQQAAAIADRQSQSWDTENQRRAIAIKADGQTVPLLKQPNADLVADLINGATQLSAVFEGCRIRRLATADLPPRPPRKPRTKFPAATETETLPTSDQADNSDNTTRAYVALFEQDTRISSVTRRFNTAKQKALIQYFVWLAECGQSDWLAYVLAKYLPQCPDWRINDGTLENVRTGERKTLLADRQDMPPESDERLSLWTDHPLPADRLAETVGFSLCEKSAVLA